MYANQLVYAMVPLVLSWILSMKMVLNLLSSQSMYGLTLVPPLQEHHSFPMTLVPGVAGFLSIRTQATCSVGNSSGKQSKQLSRKILPLRLSYAMTIWKAQGHTFKEKFVICLSTSEKEHALPFLGCPSCRILESLVASH